MMIPIMMLALATQLTVAIADDVPQFNLEPTCRGIAQQGGLDLQPNQSARQDYQSCMQSEMAVRDQLVKQRSTLKLRTRQLASTVPALVAWQATPGSLRALRWRGTRASYASRRGTRGSGGKRMDHAMNESTNDLDHSEAEILTVEFSDEAVEAAGSYPM